MSAGGGSGSMKPSDLFSSSHANVGEFGREERALSRIRVIGNHRGDHNRKSPKLKRYLVTIVTGKWK